MIHGEKEMIFTADDEFIYKKAKICHICENQLEFNLKGKPDKVHDHCHFTGKYLGAAHYKCNVNRSYNFFKFLYSAII